MKQPATHNLPGICFLAFLIVIVSIIGCGHTNKTVESKSLKDLENAISIIRDRHKAEDEIIREEEYTISVLEENIEKANSDGMKEKLREEIVVRRAVIAKAEKNQANQILILNELLEKRDSIKARKAEEIE